MNKINNDNVIGEIFKKNYIKKIGIGLDRLRKCDRGYLLEVQLSQCSNIEEFLNFVSRICMYYYSNFDEYIIDSDEYEELIDTACDNGKRKQIINSILLHSSISH